MDPQKLSQLDPKLRDVYERIMGTTIPEPNAAPASPNPQPDSAAQIQAPPLPADSAFVATSAKEATLVKASDQVDASTTPSSNPIPTPQIELQPDPAPVQIPVPEPIPQPQPAINPQQPPPTPESVPTQQAPANFVQMNSEVAAIPAPAAIPTQNFTAPAAISPVQTMALKKKKSALVPIIFVIVGLVFISIYTFFWIKFFNLKLPFLS